VTAGAGTSSQLAWVGSAQASVAAVFAIPLSRTVSALGAVRFLPLLSLLLSFQADYIDDSFRSMPFCSPSIRISTRQSFALLATISFDRFNLHHSVSTTRVFHDTQPSRSHLHASDRFRLLSRSHVLRRSTSPSELFPQATQHLRWTHLCRSWSRKCVIIDRCRTIVGGHLDRMDFEVVGFNLRFRSVSFGAHSEVETTEEAFQEWGSSV
jgi:hypothetical protein